MGHINILCGKNNSGKTSILEAINNGQSFRNVAIGREVDKDELINLFAKYFEDKIHFYPGIIRSVSNYYSRIIKSEVILYGDTIDDHITDIKKSPELSGHFSTYSENLQPIFKNYFSDLISNFNPLLLIPKRSLKVCTDITITEHNFYKSSGEYIINLLFHLKNQNPGTSDAEKYNQICAAFVQITGWSFSIFISLEGKELSISFNNLNSNKLSWISGDALGLGLHDVLILLTFIIASDSTPILIEEPETHIHPEMQRKILNFLKTVDDKQFIISTHSNIFLDPYMVDKIFYVMLDDESVKVNDETSKSQMLYNLGYSISDNLVSDVTLLTEGPTDVPVLRTIFSWMNLEDKYNIKIWSLGGDNMAQLDLSVFAERNNVFALIDTDSKSYKIRRQFQENCDNYNIPCHKLERYAIENYFTLDAIRTVFPGIGDNISKLDPLKKVEKQLGINIKNNNLKIIRLMSMNDIIHTDLYNFCEKFKKYLEQSVS